MGKMTFPDTDEALRTDESVRQRGRGSSHRRIAIVGMITQIPIDFMHAVSLDAMNHMLLMWIKGQLNCRVESAVIQNISS